jgi:hypothetical protein
VRPPSGEPADLVHRVVPRSTLPNGDRVDVECHASAGRLVSRKWASMLLTFAKCCAPRTPDA